MLTNPCKSTYVCNTEKAGLKIGICVSKTLISIEFRNYNHFNILYMQSGVKDPF